MKKTLTKLALLSIMITTGCSSFAQTVLPKDIADDSDYKQAVEIILTKDIMQVDKDGNFLPDKEITRAEFLHYLLKVLNTDVKVDIKDSFVDVKEDNTYYQDIITAKQLGLIFGYDDGTFSPNAPITHSEATSIISHITKDKFIDCSTLKPFTDKDDIPDWAKLSYSKSINYGVSINNDKHKVLEPNNYLTNKECAVVLNDLITKLTPVQEEEKQVKENVLSIEHIAYDKKSLDGTVNITNLKKTIETGNTFFVVYDDNQKLVAENTLKFVLPEGLKTNEGTDLFDKGSVLTAKIKTVKPLALEFYSLKSGDKEYKINATLAKKNLRWLFKNRKYQIILNENIDI